MKAVLFDLDGTLVDSLEDIRQALNHCMGLVHARTISLEECRTVVGRGLKRALVDALWFSRSAFPEDEVRILLSELVSYYRAHATVHTRPYDGIMTFLQEAKEQGARLGVLSNKEDGLAHEIVSTLFPAGLFDYVRGLRNGDLAKPAPGGVQDFINLCACAPGDVTMIGDSEVDWQTAKAAGTACLLVGWGYRSLDELRAAGVDAPVAKDLEGLRRLLWN